MFILFEPNTDHIHKWNIMLDQVVPNIDLWLYDKLKMIISEVVLLVPKTDLHHKLKTRTVSDLTEWYPPLAILWCSNHIPSCTSAGSVLQLCKVSFKSNEPFWRSCAYKPISPYRTYFRVQVVLSPLPNYGQQRYSFMHICRLCTTNV